MSTNLYLKAYREIFTKSGKSDIQTQSIDLMQTPTSVTYEILEFKTFEEQLEAYCKWADETTSQLEIDGTWIEIYDSEVKSKEDYFTFKEDYWDDHWVKEVVLKDDPKFVEIFESDLFGLYETEDEELVGFRLVFSKFNSEIVRKQIKKLKEQEYEFEFYAL
jgi:glutaredoxin-related protein